MIDQGEAVAEECLDTSGYHFKWKAAKKMAISTEARADDRHLLPYWERARLYFLELGGCYKDQNERDREARG